MKHCPKGGSVAYRSRTRPLLISSMSPMCSLTQKTEFRPAAARTTLSIFSEVCPQSSSLTHAGALRHTMVPAVAEYGEEKEKRPVSLLDVFSRIGLSWLSAVLRALMSCAQVV